MKKIVLIVALTGFSMVAFAQNEVEVKVKTEVNVENEDGKFHLKIVKDVDGKKTTIEKTYNSVEEMKNDPELEGIKLYVADGEGGKTFFGENGKKSDIIFFNSGDSALEKQEIKVWFDEEGQKHIMKNGVEIDLDETNSWSNEEGMTMKFEKADGKVMIISGQKTMDFKTIDGEYVQLQFNGEETRDGKQNKVIIMKSIDTNNDGEKKIAVKVIEQITLHLKEVKENEFSDVANINAKVLKTNELNYYPNPNSGKFTLAFMASKRPTEIKITSLDGKTVYDEKLLNFEGTYQNEIDLTSQKRGIYLLQIIQGRKAVNKKIIIE